MIQTGSVYLFSLSVLTVVRPYISNVRPRMIAIAMMNDEWAFNI